MNYGSAGQRWIYQKSPAFVRNILATVYGVSVNRKRCGNEFNLTKEETTKHERLAQDELIRVQFQRAKTFLKYAKEHTIFYGPWFKQHGFDPGEMRSLDELQVLPILNKHFVRSKLEEFISDETGKLNINWSHTSGTTGAGMRFPECLASIQREFAYRVRNVEWAGVRFGEPWAYCAGHPVTDIEATKPPFWVRDYASNWLIMSSYHLTRGNLPFYIDALRGFHPRLIAGYPSSLLLLAFENDRMGRPVKASAVLTSSETLLGHQRHVVESSFGCKAYSFYSNAERSGLAMECEHGRYHIPPAHCYAEVVDADGCKVEPGQEGRLIFTGFGNTAFPLVRYEIGDMGSFSKEETCPCTRSGVLLDGITGRNEDYILTADGRFVGRLDHLFKDSVHIRSAQITQDIAGIVVIRICPAPGYNQTEENKIRDEARARLGSLTHVSFEYLDELPKTESGKTRFVISNVCKQGHLGKKTITSSISSLA